MLELKYSFLVCLGVSTGIFELLAIAEMSVVKCWPATCI